MALNWEFASSDPETAKTWSEAVNRDAERQQVWGPHMYGDDGQAATRHPDSAKAQAIIRVNRNFEGGKKGNSVIVNNVARIVGRGIHNDGLAIGHRNNLNTYTQELFFENYIEVVENSGELSDQRTVMDWRSTTRPELASWVRRKKEGAIVLALWGLTAPGNGSTVLTQLNFSATESEVFLNTIRAFDTTNTYYAGNATSTATVDSGDVVTAQSLSELEREVMEATIPMEPITIDGEDCFILFLGGKGCNQLRYDQDWKDANANFTKGTNPMLKRAIGKFGMIYVVNYANALTVSSTVGRGVLCGKDALQHVPVKEPSWFEEFGDLAKRRKIISISGMEGVQATYFNGTRRNSAAFDHYIAA